MRFLLGNQRIRLLSGLFIIFFMQAASYAFDWGWLNPLEWPKKIASEIGDIMSEMVRFGVDVNIKDLKESSQILKDAADRISEAAETASGNLKEGLQDLSNSLRKIAEMPDKIDQILGKRLPEIDQILKSTIVQAENSARKVVNEFHTGNRDNIRLASQEMQNNIQSFSKELQKNIASASQNAREILEKTRDLSKDISRQFQSVIDRADGHLKERLAQLDASIKARLQDVQNIIENLDQKMNNLVDKVNRNLNALVDKINQDVHQWLDKINTIAEDRIQQISNEIHRAQQEMQQTVNLLQDVSIKAMDKLDDVSEKNLRQIQISLERIGRRIPKNFSLGIGKTAEEFPVILDITPGPIFVSDDTRKTIKISVMNFPDQGNWSVRILPPAKSNEAPQTLTILGTNPGLEELEIAGNFIEKLTPDATYGIEVQKSYEIEPESGIWDSHKKKIKVVKVARTLVSRRTEIFDLDLELHINNNSNKETIYPPSGFDKIKIKEPMINGPLFTINAHQLPSVPGQLCLRGSLRCGDKGTGMRSGVSDLQLTFEKYTVSLTILKEPGYKIFSKSEWILKERASALLMELLQKQTSENILTALSLRTSMQKNKGNHIPYSEYSINPVYVVYMEVVKNK